MVIAVSALVLNAKLKQAFLVTKKSTYTMDYFTQLEAEIEATVQEFLGADKFCFVKMKEKIEEREKICDFATTPSLRRSKQSHQDYRQGLRILIM